MKLDSNTVVHVWKWWWPVSATEATVEGGAEMNAVAQKPAVCELSQGCKPPGVQLAASPPGWTNEIARVTGKARPWIDPLSLLPPWHH